MKPNMSRFYGDEIFFTDLYRLNKDEFELYVGDGRWNIMEGLRALYQSGIYHNLYPISEEKAQELKEIMDNPGREYHPEYTKRHEELLKRIFGENETLESLRQKANDITGEYFDIEGELLPHICGDVGDEDDEFLADDLIDLIGGGGD